MKKINILTACLLSSCAVELQASPLRVEVIQAIKMDDAQWQAVNNVWCVSFYNAYKDLPFDQVDDDIQDATPEALASHLQRHFDKCRLTAMENSSSLVLVSKDEKLVGYTMYHLRNPHLLHINHFAVDPNCQGQGIGKILLEATIASNPGIVTVVLTTRILNKQAQGFYKKQGFYEIPSIDNLIFDARYSIVLQKDIQL